MAERVLWSEKLQSMKGFTDENGVDPSQLQSWLKATLDETKRKKLKVACTVGCWSRLDPIKDKLLPWIDAIRLEDKAVLVQITGICAKKFDNLLCHVKRFTIFAIVQCFLESNCVVAHGKIHVSQEDPKLKAEAAMAFFVSMHPLFGQINQSRSFIINMDQIPYNSKDTPSKTLDKRE